MYEMIKELEQKDMLKKCIKCGIIPVTVIGQKLVYEVYLKLKREGHSGKQLITNVSEETKTPERTVYRIVKKMASQN